MPQDTINEAPRFIKAREAAALIGIQKSTLYDWLSRGYLPCHRMGRTIRIDRADLDEFLVRTRTSKFINNAIDALGGMSIKELSTAMDDEV